MQITTQLAHVSTTDLTAVSAVPADQHPALVYLASLAPGSRRTMRQALDVMAGILTAQQCDHRTLPWGMLRFQHVQAVRSVLKTEPSLARSNEARTLAISSRGT